MYEEQIDSVGIDWSRRKKRVEIQAWLAILHDPFFHFETEEILVLKKGQFLQSLPVLQLEIDGHRHSLPPWLRRVMTHPWGERLACNRGLFV